MNTHFNWRPTATVETLQKRAQLLTQIRQFFCNRGVLEVETPLLCHTSVTDPYIESIPASLQINGKSQTWYLQTSPEYAMKRLLAAGSGPIFQITKAFRQEEMGKYHHPEFTMLEWYRPGFSHHDLMNEMDEFLKTILHTERAQRFTYREIFLKYLEMDPLVAPLSTLKKCAQQHALQIAGDIDERDTWLQVFFSHLIEPNLLGNAPYFIYDFPASQAALAKLNPDTPPTAARFEVYFKGVELANGFHELQDAKEQRQRFETNLQVRKTRGLPLLPIDELFLAALSHGLPACSGVALGIDRLFMLFTNHNHIADVISFHFLRA